MVSYADAAKQGPKQTPEEAAAPPPPEIEPADSIASIASTGSLIDVDVPSVHTVPADFRENMASAEAAAAESDTETEAERLVREMDAQKAAAAAVAAAKPAKARKHKSSTGDSSLHSRVHAHVHAKIHAAEKSARRADRWVAHRFAHLHAEHPQAFQAAVVGNLAATLGLGAFLGFRAWGMHAQGRLSWASASAGLALLGVVGAVEGTLASYFYRAKDKK